MVPEIPASTVHVGTGAKGSLTPEFLTLSNFVATHGKPDRGERQAHEAS